MKSQKREWKMHQQLQKRKTTQALALQKRPPIHGKKKMKLTAKIVERKTQEKLQLLPKREETEKCGCIAEWHTFLDIFLAKEVRTHFSKNGSLPNSNLVAHTLPIPCNN